MTELNRKITEANSNIEAAMQETQIAEEQYEETKAEFEREKAENDIEAKAKDFTDSVDKMRKTQLDAKDLEDGVKQLMMDVEQYNDLLTKLKEDYQKVRKRVNEEQVRRYFLLTIYEKYSMVQSTLRRRTNIYKVKLAINRSIRTIRFQKLSFYAESTVPISDLLYNFSLIKFQRLIKT